MTNSLHIVPVAPDSPAALALTADLTRELAALYADKGQDGTGGFTAADVQTPRAVFVVACAGDEPVGCGALRPYDEHTAEVKRMYTVPAWRGRGVARAILGELERQARGFGYSRIVLETGDRQPEAIGLYERCGYSQVPVFGVYVDFDDSVCFEKLLT